MTASTHAIGSGSPPGHDIEDLLSHVAHLNGLISSPPLEVIPLLQEVQAHFGYLPRNVLRYIADHTPLTLPNLYGVATFYSSFFLMPRGRRVLRVCHGTACHVQGAPRITSALGTRLQIGVGETTHDREFTLETVACLGCCSLAPVVSDNGAIVPRLDQQSAVRILFGESPEDVET